VVSAWRVAAQQRATRQLVTVLELDAPNTSRQPRSRTNKHRRSRTGLG
jgi:hypothetical protein